MFRRRAAETDQDLTSVDLDDREQGKGRPTPSRREAEAERRRRMQESARGSNRSRADKAKDRAKARTERENLRERMRAGEESALSARDRGPARRYARDLVDSRRTVGEYFLFLAIGVLVAGIVPIGAVVLASQLVLLALIVGVLADSVRVHRRVTRHVRERFPDEPGTKGVGRYGVMRALSTRRMRLPAPQVRAGDDVTSSRR